MKLDAAPLRPHLLAYLAAQGIHPTPDGFVPCPKHADHEPYKNAHVTPDSTAVHCFVCGESWDAVAIEQLRTGADFPTAARAVAKIVGVDLGTPDSQPAQSHLDRPKREKKPVTLVPLSFEDAKRIFTHDKLMTKFARENWGDKINGMWAARNERGEVEVVDVRFEKTVDRDKRAEGENNQGDDGSTNSRQDQRGSEHTVSSGGQQNVKTVISFYWDGERIQSKGCPVVLFGRDTLAQSAMDIPVCFHEGAKCWAAAGQIPGIIAVTWNRGVESVGLVPLEPLTPRHVYIYPDDDAPGFKAARKLAARLSGIAASVKICAPILRGPGFDVVDVLAQGKTPDEIRAWILEGPALEDGEDDAKDSEIGPKASADRPNHAGGSNASDKGDSGRVRGKRSDPEVGPAKQDKTGQSDANRVPFRILGVDEGYAYFIGRGAYLHKYRPESLGKNQLLQLAHLGWWATEYPGGRGSTNWDESTDYILEESYRHQFDPDSIRGRGAWRERDGRLCFHDGNHTIGHLGDNRLYLKKRRLDLGLLDSPATPAERRELLDAVSLMSFSTQVDCIRTLAWTVLAPFGGALTWRPSMILTGDSGSGKSTLLTHVIVPLVETPYKFSGIGSTEAGGRQQFKIDSCPVLVDESKGKSEKAKSIREGWLALMQQATSDDSFDIVKGSPNGDGSVIFKARNMFLFSAVEEDTGSAEQENRLIVVNLQNKHLEDAAEKWERTELRIAAALNETICRGIRAFTWENLGVIIDTAHEMTKPIHVHLKDTRRSFAEALLFAAFWTVFMDRCPDETEFSAWLVSLYDKKPIEAKRNEADEMLQSILDEVVPLQGDTRMRFSLRHVLTSLQTGRIFDEGEAITNWRDLSGQEKGRYAQTAKNWGVYLVGGEVAVKSSLDRFKARFGEHYSRMLRRHPGYDKTKERASVNGLGNVVVIANALADEGVPPF